MNQSFIPSAPIIQIIDDDVSLLMLLKDVLEEKGLDGDDLYKS